MIAETFNEFRKDKKLKNINFQTYMKLFLDKKFKLFYIRRSGFLFLNLNLKLKAIYDYEL